MRKSIGKVIKRSISVLVPPQEVEDFFYSLCTVHMIRSIEAAATIHQPSFVIEMMKQEFTKTFHSWLKSLDKDSTDEQVWHAIKRVTEIVVNTKFIQISGVVKGRSVQAHTLRPNLNGECSRELRQKVGQLKRKKRNKVNNIN